MNVYEATQERMELIFREFDNVYVSFSGGKDSGVMLNIAMDFCRNNYPGRKIGLLHMDYEAQYQMTTDYVDDVLRNNLDVLDVYRICLPMSVTTCTSMTQTTWIPWDRNLEEIWVRKLPENSVNESNHQFPFFYKGIIDYELQERFGKWYHEKMSAKKTACLVGIRTQESLLRWKAIHAERKEGTNYKNIEYSTKVFDGVFNFYPIFDWTTEDIWVANAKFNWSYNRLYDLFYQAGVPLGKQRVASPFISQGIESLKLYKVIDPNTWGKLVGRVNGVNFTGIYGGTTAMGWKSIKLPPGHTWKSYMEFLLKTLPDEVAENYKKKLSKSVKYWQEKGGEVSDETIEELQSQDVELTFIGEVNPKSKRRQIRLEYLDDVDLKEFRLIPSYKRMVVCILKNDHCCKYMGFGLTKNEWDLRTKAEEKYRSLS